jgi:mRNA interferase MazF
MAFVRGNVYCADLTGAGEKPWLVVSNNARDRALGSALVARLTTTAKPPLASVVELNQADPLVGRVLCDDITTIYDDDPHRHAGALSPGTRSAVASALRVALGL